MNNNGFYTNIRKGRRKSVEEAIRWRDNDGGNHIDCVVGIRKDDCEVYLLGIYAP